MCLKIRNYIYIYIYGYIGRRVKVVYVWWLLFNWWRCRNKVISAGDLVLFFLIGNFTVVHFIFE